jgi:hypothetical protein
MASFINAGPLKPLGDDPWYLERKRRRTQAIGYTRGSTVGQASDGAQLSDHAPIEVESVPSQ